MIQKEFNRVLDTLLIENKMYMEDFEQLGIDKVYSQQDVVKLIKNTVARIMNKNK